MEIPRDSYDLIAMLNRMHPEKCPAPNDRDRDIWMYAGGRALVKMLVASMEMQKADEKTANRQP
jgi:hypothetical protein